MALASVAQYAFYNLSFVQFQGRYLFPALIPVQFVDGERTGNLGTVAGAWTSALVGQVGGGGRVCRSAGRADDLRLFQPDHHPLLVTLPRALNPPT
ncbi:MAG UNVERIFIED_CONTAM: hypothetical protein LVT10_20750 [Anaerolineae bacterium]